MVAGMDVGARAQLETMLSGVDDLPSLPQIALRVANMMRAPDTSAADVEQVISSDQSLAARVLRLANSAFYGLPRSIASVRDAVVLLGFRCVSTLVLGVAASDMMAGGADDANILRVRRWRHALACATCARFLAKATRRADAEQAFVCGLLHDVGALVLDKQGGEARVQLVAACEAQGQPIFVAERAEFGFDHADVGGVLIERWGLPDALAVPIARHHSPEGASDDPAVADAARVCHLADAVARHLRLKVTEAGRVYVPPEPAAVPAVAMPEVVDALGLDADSLQPIMEDAGRMASEQEEFFRKL
jgi:HD-like signal output (HDOD) protein